MVNRYFYFNILRKSYIFSRKQIKKVLGLTDSPHQIAFGTAIGIFVAFTPTIPFQMLLAFILAWACRANKTSAVIPAWITNPITAPPIFFLEYLTGCYILGQESISKDQFMSYANKVMELSIFQPLVVIHQLKILLVDTWQDIGVALFIGSLIWAIPLGIITYPVTRKAVINLRLRRSKQKEIWKSKSKKVEEHPTN